MTEYELVRPWVDRAVRDGRDVPAAHAEVMLAELDRLLSVAARLLPVEAAAQRLIRPASSGAATESAGGGLVTDLPPILYWSPSLASHPDASPYAPGVIDATDWPPRVFDDAWRCLAELPPDAVRLITEPVGQPHVSEWSRSVRSVLAAADFLDVHLSCGHSVTRPLDTPVQPGQAIECMACEMAANRAEAAGTSGETS